MHRASRRGSTKLRFLDSGETTGRTSNFSNGAKAEAERAGFPPVGLIDGKELVGLMIEYGIGVSRGTFDVIELDESSL
ncbi:MAG: hypothetical protein WEE53_02965 [Acidimicrobiia bacterium]